MVGKILVMPTVGGSVCSMAGPAWRAFCAFFLAAPDFFFFFWCRHSSLATAGFGIWE